MFRQVWKPLRGRTQGFDHDSKITQVVMMPIDSIDLMCRIVGNSELVQLSFPIFPCLTKKEHLRSIMENHSSAIKIIT